MRSLIYLCISLTIVGLGKAQRQPIFNEACTPITDPPQEPLPPLTETCDDSLWLECLSPTDRCYCQSFADTGVTEFPLIWDAGVGSCVSPVGKECRERSSTKPRLFCGKNAGCRHGATEYGTCECHYGYEEVTGQGICAISYNSSVTCTNTNECNWESGHLDCIDGSCLCRPGRAWDEAMGRCANLIDQNCVTIDECYTGMNCTSTGTSGKCNCIEPKDINEDGFCKIGYQDPCNAGRLDDCASTLSCISNVCNCTTTQDFNGLQCINRAGADCSDGVPCAENSECVRTSHTEEVCQCISGYEDINGVCKKAFNSECTLGECNDEGYMECSLTSNRCECKADYRNVLEADRIVCKGLVGAACDDTVAGDCFGYANCNATMKICVCETGYEADNEKVCLGNFGADCDVANDACNTEYSLICKEDTNSKCDCYNSTMINESPNPYCVPKAEENCSNNPDRVCVENAVCNFANKCECIEGYESNKDGSCRKGLDTPCANDEECNADNNLVCSTTGTDHKCECKDQYTSTDDKKCLGAFGAPCSTTDTNIFCNPKEVVACNGTTCACKDKYIHQREADTYCVGGAGAVCGENPDHPTTEIHCRDNSGCSGGVCTCNGGFSPDGLQCKAGASMATLSAFGLILCIGVTTLLRGF